MVKRQRSGDKNYVNNEQFTKALDQYAVQCRLAHSENKPEPQMPTYVAESIIKMAERLATTPRFSGYSYKEDMIGNAILAAVKYAKNFDGDRFDNGFAYVTQILFSHMVMTIKKEKQIYKTNVELIQQAQLDSFGNPEMVAEHQAYAQAIADQKLQEMEKSTNVNKTAGFKLRTGYDKEKRKNTKGTPLNRN